MIRNAVMPAWQAKWIDPELPHEPEKKQPASYLRRLFTAKTSGSACLYMTCHGLYAAYLNGQRVDNFVLAPGTGDYKQRLTVQCYDVTKLLKTGENELLVVLGDGWYRGGVGVDGLRNYYGDDLALLCQLDGKENQQAADALNELVIKNGYHLNTGFLSTPDLCRVLAENGHIDTAYQLLLQQECPSWLYAVKKGATTIWETWDGVRPDGTVHDSLNHYAYGAICGWLMGGVCGIQLEGSRLTIHPYPHPSLGYAEAKWRSPAGEIRSSWRYADHRLHFEITVPIPAEIILPDSGMHQVKAGTYSYEVLQ